MARTSFVTIFDDRYPLRPVKAFEVLCLVSSWACHVRPHSAVPLYVHVVRPTHTALLEAIQAAGALLVTHEKPHDLHVYSGTFNKLLALRDQEKTEARILLDNDVAFVRDVPDLLEQARHHVMANVADKQRAPDEIVDEIRQTLGLDLIPHTWEPWQGKYQAAIDGKPAPTVRGLYFNSGVVASPMNSRLAELWQRHATMICGHFQQRFPRHMQKSAFGSDQLPLSTAIAEHGTFKLLPVEFNYRVFNFRQGECSADRIGIVHQVGLKQYEHTAFDGSGSYDAHSLVQHYYQGFMLDVIATDSLGRKQERQEAVSHARDSVSTALTRCGFRDLADFGIETATSPDPV